MIEDDKYADVYKLLIILPMITIMFLIVVIGININGSNKFRHIEKMAEIQCVVNGGRSQIVEDK